MVGMSSKIELGQLDTMLPLNPSIDVWREAQPVTKITDSLYPFGKRPTVNEVSQTFNIKSVFAFTYATGRTLKSTVPH